MINTRQRLSLLWIFIAVAGRLLPHPPNVTPITSLCIFAGTQLSRKLSLLITLLALALSDLLLAWLHGYPAFSAESIFTYSGFAVIVLLSSRLSHTPAAKQLFIYVISASLGYWLWTNFGVWLLYADYAKNMTGLITCYTAALPFLRNSLLGDVAWMAIIYGTFRIAAKHCVAWIESIENPGQLIQIIPEFS